MHNYYPKQIVPHPKYCRQLNIDGLIDKYQNLVVVRQIAGSREDCIIFTDKGEERLSGECLPSAKSMRNLSMNLLGGKYIVTKHLKILPRSEQACSPWDGKEVCVDNFSSSEHYSITEPCLGLFLYAKDVHKYVFPYTKSFNSEEERNRYAERAEQNLSDLDIKIVETVVGKFVKKGTPVDTFSVAKINHSPCQLNYWHITLDTYRLDENGFISPQDKISSSDIRMFKTLKHDIIEKGLFDIRLGYKLKRADYKESITIYDRVLDFFI